MKKRTIFAIIAFIIFLIGFVIFVNFNIEAEPDTRIERIDSLENKRDSIITIITDEIEIVDSIIIKFDSNKIEQPKNIEYYETITDSIIDDDDDLTIFFADRYRYLSR